MPPPFFRDHTPPPASPFCDPTPTSFLPATSRSHSRLAFPGKMSTQASMRRRPSFTPIALLAACLAPLACVSMPPEVREVFAPPTPTENSHFRLVASGPLPSVNPACEVPAPNTATPSTPPTTEASAPTNLPTAAPATPPTGSTPPNSTAVSPSLGAP